MTHRVDRCLIKLRVGRANTWLTIIIIQRLASLSSSAPNTNEGSRWRTSSQVAWLFMMRNKRGATNKSPAKANFPQYAPFNKSVQAALPHLHLFIMDHR